MDGIETSEVRQEIYKKKFNLEADSYTAMCFKTNYWGAV